MKSVRLPETDLANLSFRPVNEKSAFLNNWLRPKAISGSYEPLRHSLGEAASVGLPLFPDIDPTSLAQLDALVVRECKGNQQLVDMNLPPIEAIRVFTQENAAEANYMVDLPMTLVPGMRYSFWAPMIVRYGQRARIPFLDLRRTGFLKQNGLHTCFSIMHERFRALDLDFASVTFEAWRFRNNAARSIQVVEEWAEPISFDSIIEDVAETYRILNSLREITSTRRTGTDDGPLFR